MVKLSPLLKLQHQQLPHLYVGVSYLDLLERYSLLNTQTTIQTMRAVFGQLSVQKENLLKWNLPILILSTIAPASKLCTGEVECLKICGCTQWYKFWFYTWHNLLYPWFLFPWCTVENIAHEKEQKREKGLGEVVLSQKCIFCWRRHLKALND